MSNRTIEEKAAAPAEAINLQRHDFAPNCIWTFQIQGHEQLNERLLSLILQERLATPESRQCAGREMWQSQRQVGDDPPVKELFQQIFQVAKEIAEFFRWDVTASAPVCKVCWANIHPPGSYHTRHIHPATTHLSGVYYIQAPEHCGDIVFYDLPRFLGLWGAAPKPVELTYFNTSSFPVRPEAGLCVLFPGYVMHEVETNRSEGDRVGIAFNINFE